MAIRITARAMNGIATVNSWKPSVRPDQRSIRSWKGAPNSGWFGFGMKNASRSAPGGLLRQ
jgi:hypothetical protein